VKRNATGPWWWMSDAYFTAEMAHVGWACWVVLFASHWWNPWYMALAFMVFWAAPKETWDVIPSPWGEGDTWQGSLIDFVFYGVGCGIAIVLAYWQGNG
jgi:hypothetical protein